MSQPQSPSHPHSTPQPHGVAAPESISEIIAPALAQCAVTLHGVRWLHEHRRTILQIMIDSEAGVTLDDCEHVSNILTDVLDVYEISQKPYDLQVSSPGAERPLRTPDAWLQAIGRKVRIVYGEEGSTPTTVEGHLLAYSAELTTVEIRKKQQRKPLVILTASIHSGKIMVDI
ncbi:MAG: ribosome maturation factor RimP [Candidatus Dormibacteria bacterium]